MENETTKKNKYRIDIEKALHLISEEEMHKYAKYLPPMDINYAYMNRDGEVEYKINDCFFGMEEGALYRFENAQTMQSHFQDNLIKHIVSNPPDEFDPSDKYNLLLSMTLSDLEYCTPLFMKWANEHQTEESLAYSQHDADVYEGLSYLLRFSEQEGAASMYCVEGVQEKLLQIMQEIENGNKDALNDFVNFDSYSIDYDDVRCRIFKSGPCLFSYSYDRKLAPEPIQDEFLTKLRNPVVKKCFEEKMAEIEIAEIELSVSNYNLFADLSSREQYRYQSSLIEADMVPPKDILKNIQILKEEYEKRRESLKNEFPSIVLDYDYKAPALSEIIDEDELEKREDEWYEEHYEDEMYATTVVSGFLVGNSKDPKILSSRDGEQLFGFVTVLDHETGLIAFPQEMAITQLGIDDILYYDLKEDYLTSFWRDKCNEYDEIASEKLGMIKTELPLSDEIKESLRLDKDDYYDGPAFNQIITGETGCGKTYKAINDEIDADRRFAYIAPCRQLTYESYRYYADSEKDTLSSGEIKINPNGEGNFFGVYESMSPEALSKYDTLIIDEAHFINDSERGGDLLNLIAECRERDVNIKLLTATPTFSLNDFEKIELPAKFETPEKIEIDRNEAMNNIEKGMQTIWFLPSRAATYECAEELECEGISAIAMNADMTPSERLKAQIAFENKEAQVICSTNVLAQGVNFECENLIIESDGFETEEQQQQKIGRLGRPGTLKGKNEVYYFVEDKLRKPDYDPEKKTSIKKHKSDRNFIENELWNAKYEIENGYSLSYSEVKYCLSAFQEWASEYLKDPEIQEYSRKAAKKTLDMIEREHKELKETILSNMRNTPVLEQKRDPNESITPAAIGGRHK